PRLQRSSLVPYTTLFRSVEDQHDSITGGELAQPLQKRDLTGDQSQAERHRVDQHGGQLALVAFDEPFGHLGVVVADHYHVIQHGDRKSTRLNSSHVKSSY